MAQLAKEKLQQPEIVLGTSETSYGISRAVAAGRLKKIAPRLYSSRVEEPADQTIRRNLWEVLGLLFPGAVISQRTAIELKPDPNGNIYLTGRSPRTAKLPGITVHIVPGSPRVEGDVRYGSTLWLASPARAYLENLSPARARDGRKRTLDRPEIEDRLERTLQVSGESGLNKLRDEAKAIAPRLELERELSKLQEIISKLLGSRPGTLKGASAAARLAGLPYDAERVALFDALVAELRMRPMADRPTRALDDTWFETEAFFDAYFSNYIEGTEFEIDEAIGIVFEGQIPTKRPKDAHDVLGTYRLLSDRTEMQRSVVDLRDDLEAFLAVLQQRHHTILAGRPEADPGMFKTKPNRAGNTFFVAPELVRGTLGKGMERFGILTTPFARAVFMMFMIAEVHPFSDGNGRVARVMMNAELLAASQQRIIIPNVYRDDYLGALRGLTRKGRTEPLAEMLDRAQLFSSRIYFNSVERARAELTAANAFMDPTEGKLMIPDAREESRD